MPWCAAQWWKHLPTSKRTTPIRLLNRLEKGDASYYVEAAAVKMGNCGGKPEEKPKEDKLLKLLKSVLEERAGWNEVVRQARSQA